MASEIRKLLLIGATGFDRVQDGLRLDCTTWDRLSDFASVRDYDVLILNLLSIDSAEVRAKVDWNKFHQLLDFSAATDVLTHNGIIIILGDPRFEIQNLKGQAQPFLSWTGADFEWYNQPGDSIKFDERNGMFKGYVKHLRAWDYSLRQCRLNKAVFAERWDTNDLERKGHRVSTPAVPICANRVGHSVAFTFFHRVTKDGQIRIPYGLTYVLPKLALPEDETLQIVLRDFCDVPFESPEPEWLADINIPGQKSLDERIAQINLVLAEQQAALKQALAERAEARTCLKLLYESEYALAPAVRDALRALGAEVEDPTEKGKEDGWISIQIADKKYEGVLGVASTRAEHFDEGGWKQVVEGIERGRTIRNKNCKGIFIGNSAVAKPLRQLSDRPNAFSGEWRNAARQNQICALRAEELFLIYLLLKQGKLNLDQFWTTLFTTDGIFDIRQFLRNVPKPSPVEVA
jgi:hypothetical protein